MKLSDLRDSGLIPQNMEDRVVIGICRKLGMKVSSMNSIISNYEISKLNLSKPMNDFRIRNAVVSKHLEVIAMYDNLITKYNNVIKQMNGPEFASEKAELQALVTKIGTDKANYKRQIKVLNFSDHDKLFGFDGQNKIIGAINKIGNAQEMNASINSGKVDYDLDSLDKEYKKVESMSENTLLEKASKVVKMKQTKMKIARLQRKKGRYQDQQHKIIVSNTDLYVYLMEGRFEKYQKSFDKVNKKFEKKANYVNEINNINGKITDRSKTYYNLQSQKVGQGLFKQIAITKQQHEIGAEIKKMQRQVKKLNRKKGRVDVSKQISKASKKTL